MTRTLAILATLLVTSAVQCRLFCLKTTDVTPAHVKVDLKRYQGRWYSIASIDHPSLGDCVCSTAEYTLLKSGKIEVLNICSTAQNKKVVAPGLAVPRNTDNTKLEVFFYGHGYPYWIMAIGNTQNYDHVIIGGPERLGLYILSRTPQMATKTYNSLVAVAKAQGYDTSKLVKAQVKYCLKNKTF